MGLPQISISFKQLATTLVQRSSRGIIAMILNDAKCLGLTEIYDSTDIPNDLNAENKNYIEMTLIGNVNAPNKILTYVIGGVDTLENALEVFETQDFNYLCMPNSLEADKTKIQAWIIKMRDIDKVKVKSILGEVNVNHEGIINFTTKDIEVNESKYSSEKFTPRIAGLVGGTPLSQSITYSKLNEVTSIPKMARIDANKAIDEGKLILVKEAGAIRIGRGVNSLKEATSTKGDLFKKIKILDVLDLIHSDCKKVIIDQYVGKVANSYMNKLLLVVSIREYLEEIAKEQLIQNDFIVDIDIEAQKAYLRTKNIDTNAMSEQEAREANTGSNVFLKAKIKALDSVEDVDLVFEF